jgi:hypothetical protein
MRWLFALLVLVFSRDAFAEPRHIDWFAFDIDVGGGRVFGDEWFFLGRTRVGYVRVRDDLFSSIGVAAETKDFAHPRFGIAGEVLTLDRRFPGLAGHAAIMSSTSGDIAFELGAGWAGLRLEGQVALTDPTTFTVVALARLPLAAVLYVMSRP